jgi:hypothetical protein
LKNNEKRRINDQQLFQDNSELIEKFGGGIITFTFLDGIWFADLSFASLVYPFFYFTIYDF